MQYWEPNTLGTRQAKAEDKILQSNKLEKTNGTVCDLSDKIMSSYSWKLIFLLVISLWSAILLYLTHLTHSLPTNTKWPLPYYCESKKPHILSFSNISLEKKIHCLQIHSKFWQEFCEVIQQEEKLPSTSFKVFHLHCNKPIWTRLSFTQQLLLLTWQIPKKRAQSY